MLKEGRLIAVRTHTRFVYFPAHRHNFVEVLYVCEGSLTNIIDGKKVVVNKGELLFLNQFTKHEILKAGQNDIAINFMVLPEFFDVAYSMTGNDNMLADFLVNVLRQDEERGEYLHFKVAEVLQIQNLLENIIYSLVTGRGNQNRINQTTMGLIFMYLVESVQYVEMRLPNQYENMISMTTLDYIEQKYRTATLTELCTRLHLPMHVLSKMIKKNSGGEGQNPLYVALLASFAQAYGIHLSPKVRRNPSIRLVVLDEAFSKMDAEKVASCIDLIRNLGFQAIISATNDKIQNYLENVDKTFVYANPNKKNISIQEFEKCEFDNLLTEE